MSILEKKFKKLFKELQYNQSELDFVMEILKEAHWDFERYYRDYCEAKDIDLDSLNNQFKDRVDNIVPAPLNQQHDESGDIVVKKTEFKDNTDLKYFKKLYRQAVKKCHPDLGGNEVEFKKLSRAHDEKDWEVLLEICDKYNIKLDDYHELNNILKKQIEKVKGKIKKQKSTYSWLLHECEENETCKNNVVKKFLKHLFDYGDYK